MSISISRSLSISIYMYIYIYIYIYMYTSSLKAFCWWMAKKYVHISRWVHKKKEVQFTRIYQKRVLT